MSGLDSYFSGNKMQSQGHEDIAIIGMGCRLPGGVKSPEDLWNRLGESWDGWSEIPKTRFNPEAYHHPNPGKHGSVSPARPDTRV